MYHILFSLRFYDENEPVEEGIFERTKCSLGRMVVHTEEDLFLLFNSWTCILTKKSSVQVFITVSKMYQEAIKYVTKNESIHSLSKICYSDLYR